MKTLAYRIFLLSFFLLVSTQFTYATTYQWVGNTSTDWATGSNWSPSGVPDSADHITVSSGTYNLVLDQNRRVSNLTLSTKTIDLNGHSLTVYGTATMTSGTVTGGNFIARGTLAAFNGTLMDCPVDAVCGYIRLSGSTFNETADFTDTGTATGTGTGGCTFNDDVTITHGGTLTYFTLANTNGDAFNGNVTFTNNSNRELYVATNGSTQFNGNIILNSTSTGGILFGNGTGNSTLASGKTISIGSSGFAADFLTLKNFTQNGNTAQTLTLTGTAVVNMIAATFNGNITVTAPGFLLKNNTFNGTTTLTRNGTSGNHQSDGGNTFNNAVSIDNAGTAGRIRWATILPDTYNADATFSSSGGQDVQIAYSGNNTFSGNITINSNKVVFNTSTGKVTLTGTNNQTLNGSYNYPFKKLAINKTSGTVTANTTLSVDDSLIFILGNLITTSTNLLTMKHGSTATGASNSSFVSGPVKKVGNTGFSFPIGKQNGYLPLEISAPSTTTSEFVAEYKLDTVDVHTIDRDASLGFIFRDRYWTLSRTSGTSNVYVTLSWNDSYHLEDSLITTCFWNGSMWKDQGTSNATGSDSLGTMRTASTQSSFAEFTLGYKSYTALGSNALNCQHIQSQALLKWCLVTGNPNCIVTGNINLVQSPVGFLSMPMPVYAGVHLKGFNDVANTDAKWWEAGCPLLTSNNRVTYDPNQVKQMFVFELYEGGVIENLKLRGPDCNFRDFNGDNLLSGGIFAVNYGNLLSAKIESCEISCFSYAGVFKGPNTKLMEINNSYIHKVKANGHTTGIGYGVWSRSNDGTASTSHFANVIFDDCKAATDGQGYRLNSIHDHCTFTQFFVSEDVNLHNTDGPEKCFTPNSSCGLPNDCFYGYACTPCNNTPICTVNDQVWIDCSSPFSILDIGGESNVFTNCIFHKFHNQSQGQSNITLPFPKFNDAYKAVKIENSVFATPLYAPEAFMSQKNRGGFARVADNYINSCVYSGFFTNISNNTFGYTPETSTLFAQPKEFSLELFNNNGTQPLPYTFNFSATSHRQKIQSVDLNTSFKVVATPGPYGSNQFYIFRPNPNSGVAGTNGVLSKNNYFYQDERYSGNGTWTYTGYDKPGLYGIDVLAMDVSASEFNASRWEHIPVVVKPSAQTDLSLYFNIKDSYDPINAGFPQSGTGVKKRASLNGFPIWEEDIQDGGEGWEYVVVPLTGNVIGTTDPILSILNMNGNPDTLTFSIVLDESVQINSDQIRGVLVWVDDVYIPKSNYTNGDNLIEDGTIELSDPEAFAEEPTSNSMWFQTDRFNLGNCTPLRVLSGADGQDQLDEPATYVDLVRTTPDIATSLYTDAGITSIQRKSGSLALQLVLPGMSSCPYYDANDGHPVISVNTLIDFTEMLPCGSYASNPLNFIPLPCSTGNQVLTNERYLVSSDYTLCGNLFLQGCQIAIEPGVKIIVPNGRTLSIDHYLTVNSHLFACEEMWQGIIVEAGGNLVIKGNKNDGLPGTIIEHAEVAIDAINTSVIDLMDATFDHNNISVRFNPGVFSSLLNNRILNTEFYCSNFQMTKSPFSGIFPESHLILNDVSGDMQIGNTSQSGSAKLTVFENALHAISCTNSNLRVAHSIFNNIYNKDDVFNPQTMASAIKVVNSIPGLDNDIIIGHDVFGNNFTNVNIGIELSGQLTNSGNFSIFKNTFDNSEYTEAGSLSNFHNTAIVARNGRFANTTALNIYSNSINDFRIGIYAANISDALMGYLSNDFVIPRANTINFNFEQGFAPSEIYRGIWLQNCHRTLVANSDIANSQEITGTTTNFRGIELQHCYDGRLNCNNINNIPFSFYFLGHCEGTLLRANEMEHYDAGVYLETATIADQFQVNASGINEPTDNIWYDPDTGIDPGTSLPNPTDRVTGETLNGLQFNWHYRTSGGIYNPLDAGMTSQIIAATPETAGAVDCAEITDRQSRMTRFGPTVADTLAFASFEEENLWMARKYAYECMKADTTILYGDTLSDAIYQSFFYEQDSLNTGRFTIIRILSADSATFGDAAALNELVDDEISLETHLKEVNSYYFTKLALGDTLDDSDSSAIFDIAMLPYFEGGEAAFIGIGMLGLEHTPSIPQLRVGNEMQAATIPPIPEIQSIAIYPNPTHDSFYVKTRTGLVKKLEIYDAKLKLLQTIETNMVESEISLKYKPGIYGLKLDLQSGETQWFKLVKL